jgi:multimeric flavodoxin WrbA
LLFNPISDTCHGDPSLAGIPLSTKTETVALASTSVLPCLAWDTCHRKGRCPQKDEFESIKEKIFESDGIVLASPNYIFSVSAQLKAFMDRFVAWCTAWPLKGSTGPPW